MLERKSMVVLDSCNSFLRSNGKKEIGIDKVEFIDEYICEGYGMYNQEIIKTIRDTIINEGIPMDTTYVGKAFWGMNKYIYKNNIKNKNILFIHTGGTPLFFDDMKNNIKL